MSQNPVQIIARGPRSVAEAAASNIDETPLLEGATYSILEEDEDRGLWRIDAFPTSDEEAEGLRAVLADYEDLVVTTEELADADWLAMSLSGLPPVRAGRFFVYGAHDRGRAPSSTVNLRIEAGAAFGTGHHGTTTGCLLAFDDLLKRERFERVLDVGCGTGVLAIAAARTGSRVAVGTDIDWTIAASAPRRPTTWSSQTSWRRRWSPCRRTSSWRCGSAGWRCCRACCGPRSGA